MMRKLTALLCLAVPAMAATSRAVSVSEAGNKVTIGNELFAVSYDLKSGSYSGKNLATGLTVLSNARFTVDEMGWKQPEGVTRRWSEEALVDLNHGPGRRLTITETPNAGYRPVKSLHLTVFEEQPFAVLGFSVTNPHTVTARICRVGVLDGAKFLPGKELADPRVLKGGAGAEPNRVQTDLVVDAHNNLLITGKVEGKRQSLVVGGLHYRDFLRRIVIDERRKELAVTIEDPQGKRVEPGTTYEAVDTVFLDFNTSDPFLSLERYGLALRQANDAKPKIYDFPTLCGWMVSTGSYGEGKPINNSKDLVGQMELARDSGILAYTPVGIRLEPDYYCNRNYGDTQQGWWNDEVWSKYGHLTEPYETFAKFNGRLRELGGIPFTYIQVNMPSNDFALAHPEWMLNNDISRLHAEHRHHMPFVKFDFTDPGFQAHTLAMWKRLREDGLLGIKFDYPESGWCLDGGFEDKTHTTTTAYRKIFELCREGLGEEGYIHERNLGEYGTPRLDVTAGIVDLQRVWGDASHFEPEMASRIGLRWYKNRTVFGYYPDGKSFKKLDADQRRTMLTLVGLLSGRVELGTSFGRMTPEEQRDLTRLYPMFPGLQSFRPVDMLVEGRTDPSVYTYQVDEDWMQVILCNNHEEEKEIGSPLTGDRADTGALGLDPEATYYAYDFWNDRLVGEFDANRPFVQTLPPRHALSYALRRKLDRPQLLSTNRHIMQGMVELENVHWNAAGRTLSGKAHVVGGEPFVLTLANNGLVPVAAKAPGAEVTLDTEDGLTRVTLSTKNNVVIDWQVTWAKPAEE